MTSWQEQSKAATAKPAPILLETHELSRRPGEQWHVEREYSAPADLGVDLIGVPAGTPLRLELDLTSVGDGILVNGNVSTPLVAECARCLTSFDDEGTFTIEEFYYYPGKDAEEGAMFVENDQLDLEPAIRDAIVLNLPFAPLCRDDCAGLCVRCGANLNEDPQHSHGPETDPRWSGLSGLFDQNNDAWHLPNWSAVALNWPARAWNV
jgi:uncharacterized protein